MAPCSRGPLGGLVRVLLFSILLPSLAWADSVRGRVLDPDDRPVAFADVLVLRGSAVILRTRTNAEGRFGPLTLAPGVVEIVASAPGLRSSPRAFTIESSSALDIDVRLALSAIGETVVVSAAQVETPLSRVTSSVTIVDDQTLETRQTTVVADALRLVPGFNVVATGGHGALTSLFPRGGESDYTLVLVDGIAQNAFGGGFDAGHLSAVDAERIEVVRGPQSALYGGGAIGGIVQLVTRHGGPFDASVTTEYGRYATARTGAVAAGSGGAWSWSGAANWVRSDGRNGRELPSVGAILENDDYERSYASGGLTWSDRPGRRVRFDIRGARSDRGSPGAFGSDPEAIFPIVFDGDARGVNRSVQVGASAILSQGSSTFHRIHVTSGTYLSRFESDPADADTFSNSDTRRIGARYQFDLERWPMGLTAGAEILREREDNTFVTNASGDQIPVTRSVSGWFAEARPSFRGRLFATAGVRFERIERVALAGNGFNRPDFPDEVIWSTNPKLALAWFARSDDEGDARLGLTKLRLGVGTGIKPPTAFEIAFTNNPGLKPERSRSLDAGIEQAFASSRGAIDLTWFRNTYDDLIVGVRAEFRGPRGYRTDNIANARAQGLELGATWRTTRGLSARVAYTYLQTKILDSDSAAGDVPAPYRPGDPLLRRPRHRTAFDVAWTGARGTAFISVNGRGKMLDFEPNFASSTYENPGFATTNFGAALRFTRWINVFGRADNIFDRDYEEAFGYPALGRSATIGVRVSRGR